MSLFTVDSEKCVQDGICAETCPMQIIAVNGAGELPTPIQEADALCINCGHCVAVCPTGAFSLSTMKSEDCPSISPKQLISPDQATQFLRSRRSIRTYTDQKVDRQLLLKLIEIASCAPSGSNSQPVAWRVIYDSEQVRHLAGLVVDWMRHVIINQPDLAGSLNMERIVSAWESGNERICRGAPHVVIAHAPKDHRAAPAACTIGLTYLELAAFAFGLGACWGGYFNAASNLWQPMKDALELPDEHSSYGALMVGYPSHAYYRIPFRNAPNVSWK